MKCIGISVHTSSGGVNLLSIRCILVRTNGFADRCSRSRQLFFNRDSTALLFLKTLWHKKQTYNLRKEKNQDDKRKQAPKKPNNVIIAKNIQTTMESKAAYFDMVCNNGSRRRGCRWDILILACLVALTRSRRWRRRKAYKIEMVLVEGREWNKNQKEEDEEEKNYRE